MTHYFTRESEPGQSYRWLHFLVIEDKKVTIIDMAPALIGWNHRETTIQGEEDWPGMSAESIIAFKKNDDRMRPSRPHEVESIKRLLAR